MIGTSPRVLVEFLEVEPVISGLDVALIIGFDFSVWDVGFVVLVVVFSSIFAGVVTVIVDVGVASVVVFAAAAVLVLADVVVLSILVVVFVFVAVVGNVLVGVAVNVVAEIDTFEELLNCVTGSTKETQSRYEKVNFNKV